MNNGSMNAQYYIKLLVSSMTAGQRYGFITARVIHLWVTCLVPWNVKRLHVELENVSPISLFNGFFWSNVPEAYRFNRGVDVSSYSRFGRKEVFHSSLPLPMVDFLLQTNIVHHIFLSWDIRLGCHHPSCHRHTFSLFNCMLLASFVYVADADKHTSKVLTIYGSMEPSFQYIVIVTKKSRFSLESPVDKIYDCVNARNQRRRIRLDWFLIYV